MLDDTRLGAHRALRPVRMLVSLVQWMTREVLASLTETGTAVARALPLLVGVVTFFFFTGEVWQTVGQADPLAYTLSALLFVGTSAAFLAGRGQLDLEALGRFDDDDALAAALEHTPYSGMGASVTTPATCPLTHGQERLVRLVATTARLVLASVVALSVLAFFLVLGVLTVSPQVIEVWAGAPPSTAFSVTLLERTYAVTAPLLKVAGFLAVFSGFYFAVVSMTDPTLRQGMRDTATDAVREACAARLVLLAEGGGRESHR